MTRQLSLASVQRTLQAHILADPASTIGTSTRLLRVEADADKASIRLGIYAHAYRARLVEVLINDFPALHRLLGEDRFDELARGYIASQPSVTPSARWYGRQFADFLTRQDPLIAELARFEWAQGEVFDAAGDAPIEVADLARISPDRWGELRFEFGVPIRRLELASNAAERVRAHHAGDDALPELRADPVPRVWLLWRRELMVHWRAMPVIESTALDLLIGGGDFAALCERLATSRAPGEAAAMAAQLLARWFQDQLITAILPPR